MVFRYGNFFIPRVEKSSKISPRSKKTYLPKDRHFFPSCVLTYFNLHKYFLLNATLVFTSFLGTQFRAFACVAQFYAAATAAAEAVQGLPGRPAHFSSWRYTLWDSKKSQKQQFLNLSLLNKINYVRKNHVKVNLNIQHRKNLEQIRICLNGAQHYRQVEQNLLFCICYACLFVEVDILKTIL